MHPKQLYRTLVLSEPPFLSSLLLLILHARKLQRIRLGRIDKRRHKHGHLLLILLVLRVFASTDRLREDGRALEQDKVADCTGHGPVEKRVGGYAGPLVDKDPDGLFGGEVGMAGPREETCGVEAAVEFVAREARGDFSGFAVLCPGGVVVYRGELEVELYVV